ncbi:hypothetical protein [Treponema sp. R80B11-R83G3]
MGIKYENGKILEITNIEDEMLWAKDVLKRAETSWPDLADIDTAIMVLEQTKIIFIRTETHNEQFYCENCFYKNKKNIDIFPKPEGKCHIGAAGYFLPVLKGV